MLSQNKIKYITSLQSKKFRQKYNFFIAEGDKICLEILEDRKLYIEDIFATTEWVEKNQQKLNVFKQNVSIVSDSELKKISSLSTPNQVLMTIQKPDFQIDNSVSESLILYIDGVQDPGNMGTILRNADWFGIPYVFCSDSSVDIYNSKVIQASMGAFLRVKSKEIAFSELLELINPSNIYGAVLDGENIFNTALNIEGVIVIGSEGKGISDNVLPFITKKIKIPSFGNGAESLNAAVASGIICAIFRNKH